MPVPDLMRIPTPFQAVPHLVRGYALRAGEPIQLQRSLSGAVCHRLDILPLDVGHLDAGSPADGPILGGVRAPVACRGGPLVGPASRR
eukprot:2406948-Pyramimonas_sp.AAC.1